MGSARNRSWSFSRQNLFQRCPRAFLFQYFPWGEPEQDLLWFLKRVKTVPLLVGELVHDSISLALRQLKETHFAAKGLHVMANIQYEAKLKSSLRVAEIVRRGCKAPGKGTVLSHHLSDGKRSSIEEAGRETLEESLRAFEASEAWRFLQTTYPQNWLPIATDSDDKPHIIASQGLGFRQSIGLRVYTPYDLALSTGGDFIIVDWKTGKRTESALEQVRKQTASYCLWALDRKYARRTLRVQPFFLVPGEQWDPKVVANAQLDEVVAGIEQHDAAELELLRAESYADGTVKQYVANREDFPAKPMVGVCSGCKFLTVCQEGKKAVAVA